MNLDIIKVISIPGQLISKKNNMQANKIGNHLTIGHKKIWKVYEKQALKFLEKIEPIPLHHFEEGPVYMHVWHYRKDKRAFDHNNIVQGICDILQGDLRCKVKDMRHQIIPEDDNRHLIPVHESPFAGYSVDKDNPRTMVTFTTDCNVAKPEDFSQMGIMAMLDSYWHNNFKI